jgi:hypothetical protein
MPLFPQEASAASAQTNKTLENAESEFIERLDCKARAVLPFRLKSWKKRWRIFR